MVKISMVKIVIITGALGGCSTAQPLLTPIEVKVPVATPVYCQVGKLDHPALPISTLKVDSVPDDTIRAYAATVAVLKGAVRERDLVIEGCAAPASAQDSAPPLVGRQPSHAGEDVK